jgi:hypothetical protein
MANLPTGTVTFLFTDTEGSTRLWEQHPEQMRAVLARHDALLMDCIGHRLSFCHSVSRHPSPRATSRPSPRLGSRGTHRN